MYSVSQFVIYSLLWLSIFFYVGKSFSSVPKRIAVVRKTSSIRLQCSSTSVEDYYLTPRLKLMTDELTCVGESMKYDFIIDIGSELAPMDPTLKISDNKVRGCLSNVYVHATLDKEKNIHYTADADSQLTKGLVGLLVIGFSGYPIDEILKVKPDFIIHTGLSQSLTPGRNNGFLNIFKLMQMQAIQLKVQEEPDSPKVETDPKVAIPTEASGPMQQIIREKLSILEPTLLHIENESQKHIHHHPVEAGDSETQPMSSSGESHFRIEIVSPLFENVPLVKRHAVIYTLLEEELATTIHALSISAKTPQEQSATTTTTNQPFISSSSSSSQ